MEVVGEKSLVKLFLCSLAKVATLLLFGILLSLFALIVVTSEAQTNGSRSSSNTLLNKGIEKDKPSIYLSYVGAGSINENCSLKKQPTYQLKLHNNSPYPININANYNGNFPTTDLKLSDGTKGISLPDGSKVTDICYQAEPILKMDSSYENGKIAIEIPIERSIPAIPITCRCVWSQQRTRRYDAYPGVWIPSGSSIVFDVPQQFLEKDLKIYTLFNFEWEFKDGLIQYDEPHHQVYFYSSDIPKI